MKIRIHYLTLLLISIFTLSACQTDTDQSYDIVTTLFPQYDIAKQIAGDRLSVTLLIPFGTEAHEYGPTAKDIIRIKESKLFLYTSDEMERWVSGILDDSVNALNLSKHYVTQPYKNSELTLDDADTMHYWTDSTNVLQLINMIRDEIVIADPDNASYYIENALAYYDEIEQIHLDALTFFESLDKPKVYFAGHNAMGAFGNRYDLSIITLSENFKPDADITSGQIENLKNQFKTSGQHYLFTEELVEPRAANTIKNELTNDNYDVIILELHGYHNITKKQDEEDISYADLFRQNVINLKQALSN